MPSEVVLAGEVDFLVGLVVESVWQWCTKRPTPVAHRRDEVRHPAAPELWTEAKTFTCPTGNPLLIPQTSGTAGDINTLNPASQTRKGGSSATCGAALPTQYCRVAAQDTVSLRQPLWTAFA